MREETTRTDSADSCLRVPVQAVLHGPLLFCWLRREARSNLRASSPHSRLEQNSLLLNSHGELMRKKRGVDAERKNVEGPTGAAASERNSEQVEFEISFDLGPDLDPEGWMAERRSYWTKQGEPKKLGAAAHCVAAMRAILARLNPLPSAHRRKRLDPVTEWVHEDWSRLSESALGPLRPIQPNRKTHGVPDGALGRKAPSVAWKAGELMSAPVKAPPLLSASGTGEHPKEPIPEVETDAAPAAARPHAARRPRP